MVTGLDGELWIRLEFEQKGIASVNRRCFRGRAERPALPSIGRIFDENRERTSLCRVENGGGEKIDKTNGRDIIVVCLRVGDAGTDSRKSKYVYEKNKSCAVVVQCGCYICRSQVQRRTSATITFLFCTRDKRRVHAAPEMHRARCV